MKERALNAGVINETAVKRLGEFIEIHHLEPAVRIEENIGKQIRHGQNGSVFIPVIIDNIAIPV